MYTYFVGEENSAYYHSSMFGRLLTYLTTYPRRVKIRQTASKQSFSIANVRDISTAVSILKEILAMPVSK